MPNFIREMGMTVLVKLILLVVLWVVCVKGLQPHLQVPKKWFFDQDHRMIHKQQKRYSNDSNA